MRTTMDGFLEELYFKLPDESTPAIPEYLRRPSEPLATFDTEFVGPIYTALPSTKEIPISITRPAESVPMPQKPLQAGNGFQMTPVMLGIAALAIVVLTRN